jgi:hypothetical protein
MTDSGPVIGVLAGTAALMRTNRLGVNWMVIETSYFDGRQDGCQASAYELIAQDAPWRSMTNTIVSALEAEV